MAFLIRTITQRATGGEIIRQTRVDSDSLTVGRGTDCDLQIADLGVMLVHARLARTGERIAITAIGDSDIIIDGRRAPNAVFDAGDQARIRLGGHLLSLAPGEPGETIVTLERVAALSDAPDAADEAHVFSLAGTRFSKRRLAWSLALAMLALFLAWPAWSFFTAPPRSSGPAAAAPQPGLRADHSWSSGPLSLAHQSLASDCGACHQQPFVAVRDDACQACHTDVHAHAPADRLRAAMFDASPTGRVERVLAQALNLPQERCTSCHKEHNGAAGAAARDPGQCVDCHRDLAARLPDTPLGDAADFARAHPEFRPTVVATPTFGEPVTRRVPLATARENSGLKFPHKLHLSTTNGVARMAQGLGKARGYGDALACGDCHRPSTGEVRFAAIDMERDCGACHSLVFSTAGGLTRTLRHGSPQQVVAELRDFYRLNGTAAPRASERRRPGITANPPLAPAASIDARIRAVFQPGGACYDCHEVIAPPRPGSLAFGIAPVALNDRYLRQGWFSHADHDTANMPCSSCHAAGSSMRASDLLLPGIARCRDCHAGAHPGKNQIATDCASCHSFHTGAPVPSQIKAERTTSAQRSGGEAARAGAASTAVDGKAVRTETGPDHARDQAARTAPLPGNPAAGQPTRTAMLPCRSSSRPAPAHRGIAGARRRRPRPGGVASVPVRHDPRAARTSDVPEAMITAHHARANARPTPRRTVGEQ